MGGIILIPLLGIAGIATLIAVASKGKKPAAASPSPVGPLPGTQPTSTSVPAVNEVMFDTGADGVRRFKPPVAQALVVALDQYGVTPVTDDKMTVELRPRTSPTAVSAKQWATAVNPGRSILAVHWIMMPFARQYLRAVMPGHEQLYAQARGGEYAVLANVGQLGALSSTPPALPSTTTPVGPGTIPVPVVVPPPSVVLPPPGGTVPTTTAPPVDGPPPIVAPPPEPPIAMPPPVDGPPPIVAPPPEPPIATPPPAAPPSAPPASPPPVVFPPVIPGVPPIIPGPPLGIPPLGMPPTTTPPPGTTLPETDVFSELPPELQTAARVLHSSGTDPNAMEAVANELAKQGWTKSAGALRQRAKELRGTKTVTDTIEGRTFTIQSGHIPSAVAKHYTGDAMRWKELPKVNTGMKVVKDAKGQTQLRPWRVSQVVTLPEDWDVSKGTPPAFSSAPSVAAPAQPRGATPRVSLPRRTAPMAAPGATPRASVPRRAPMAAPAQPRVATPRVSLPRRNPKNAA